MRGLRAGRERPYQLGRPRSYYVCRGHHEIVAEQRCRARHAPGSRLDELVWKDLCEVLTHPEHVKHALRRAHGGEWLPQELKARLESVGKAVAQTERQKRRLLDAYLGGVLELAEFERKRKELEGRTDALFAQKRQLEAAAWERTELAGIADSIERFCEQVKVGLSSATFEQKRRLVELLVDRVVVTDEEVEIRYVVPTSSEGPHQLFCHLRTDYLRLVQEVAHRRDVGASERRVAPAAAFAARQEPET